MYKNTLDRYPRVEPCIRMVSEDGKRKVKENRDKRRGKARLMGGVLPIRLLGYT